MDTVLALRPTWNALKNRCQKLNEADVAGQIGFVYPATPKMSWSSLLSKQEPVWVWKLEDSPEEFTIGEAAIRRIFKKIAYKKKKNNLDTGAEESLNM